MSLLLPLSIGLRYAFAKRENGFIAFVSGFALLGMALGVFALIVVMSVMNGLENETRSRILKVVPHATLSQTGGVRDWPALLDKLGAVEAPALRPLGAAPYIAGKGLLSSNRRSRPVEIRGVEPNLEAFVSEIHRSMRLGAMEGLQAGEYGIVLGNIVARSLGVTQGDKVTLTLPEVSVTLAGVFPRTKRFTVTGIFEVGAQVDESLVLIHLNDAQKLFRRGDTVEGLRLRFEDIFRAPQVVQDLADHLKKEHPAEQYRASDWSQTQGSLFQALRMEKVVTAVMLSIIIAVAAFNIVTSLVMMVAEKRSDIAVLRTLGAKRSSIVMIFMCQGLSLGMVGIFIGLLLGTLTALGLSDLVAGLEAFLGVQIFDPSVYFVSFFPSIWRFSDALTVTVLAMVICLLATIYPALRASAIEPAEALRYDI